MNAPRMESSPLIMTNSAQFLNKLRYSEGFGPQSIITQSEIGLCANPEGLDDATKAKAAARLNTNAAMPLGAATEMDKVILQSVTAEPLIYSEMQKYGCTSRFPLGTYIARYSKVNLAQAPSVQMDYTYQGGQYSNASQSQNDYKDVYTPIPLQFYDFALSKRQIAAANNTTSMFGGLALETEEIRNKTIGLASGIEQMIWNGNQNVTMNETPLYGILTQPEVANQASSLTFSKSQPDLFIQQFLQQGIQPILNRNYTPSNFMIYYSLNMANIFESDYLNQLPLQTITSRLMKIPGVMGVRGTAYLNNPAQTGGPFSSTNGTMVVVKMAPNVIDLAVESNIQVAQYANNPMEVRYVMFSACAPRIKVDYYGNVGIQLINLTVTS